MLLHLAVTKQTWSPVQIRDSASATDPCCNSEFACCPARQVQSSQGAPRSQILMRSSQTTSLQLTTCTLSSQTGAKQPGRSLQPPNKSIFEQLPVLGA
eukprot:1159547-Pelagomonas_calceolata.AAC.14